MDQENIIQTALDQMVCSDKNQLIKAAIPYLPLKGQQILSIYTKARELSNTMTLFSHANEGTRMQAAALPSSDPMEAIDDIRRFCYGESRHKLDQMVNMMAIAQMLQMMSEKG